MVPFALRRPWLLLRDLTVDRSHPDLERLARIRDPERFLWAILPHAARSFSLCITLLPARSAKAAAVAYLNCRILDSYEDLLPDLASRTAALRAYAARFTGDTVSGPAPAPDGAAPVDARDRAHLLLVERCAAVDRVFLSLPSPVRVLIGDLVRAMAAGMIEGAQRFAEQRGVLRGDAQRERYAAAVLGEPVRFVTRLALLHREGRTELSAAVTRTTLRAGAFIQFANFTRDIEADLARGVAYHGLLAADLRADLPRPTRAGLPRADDADTAARLGRVRRAREHMLRQALLHAPDYGDLLALLDAGRGASLLRASAQLMLFFTDRHYRGTALRCAQQPWGRRESVPGLLARALLATLAPRRARAHAAARVATLRAAADELEPTPDDPPA